MTDPISNHRNMRETGLVAVKEPVAVKKNSKKRRLQHYLKNFKYNHTHCACCQRPLDRVTLLHNGKVIDKHTLQTFNILLDEQQWQAMHDEWQALCRFCSSLYTDSSDSLPAYFDLPGFWHYLLHHSNLSIASAHEYIVRLRRLNQRLAAKQLKEKQPLTAQFYLCIEQQLPHWLAGVDLTPYIIALHKYGHYQTHR